MAGLVNNLLILFLVFQNSCLGYRSPLSVFKRYKDTTRSLSNECLGNNRPVIPLGRTDFALDIRMPGVTPKQSDTYLCMSLRLPVDEEAYVVDFKPHASMDTVHHMLLFGCNMPSSTENYWDCDEGTCTDESNILYAWARNAPPTKLPSGVGFKVGGKTGSKYFVLQVHYGDISAFREMFSNNYVIRRLLRKTICSIKLQFLYAEYNSQMQDQDTFLPQGGTAIYTREGRRIQCRLCLWTSSIVDF